MLEESEKTVFSKFGIEIVGEVPWGTHLCQFYESKQDLIDILVPYFAEGLQNNEFCMWVTSPPLEVPEARKALKKAVPDIEKYERKGQLEIISYNDWYLLGGKFDCDRVLQGWVDKENKALSNGFEGLRLTGNTFWIERSLWKSFVDYETAVNAVIGKHNMIALCTYCLLSCSGTDVVDVVRNHVGTLIKQGGKWVLVEDAIQRQKVEEALRKSEVLKSASLYARKLIEVSPDPLVTISPSGQITDVNKATEVATGIPREKLIGTDFSNYFTEPEKAREGYRHVFERGFVKDYPLAIRHTSGKIMHVLYNAAVYKNEAGEVLGVFAAARDVTKRMEAEAAVQSERKRLFDVLEALPAMVCLLTPDHHVAFANRSFREKFGESKGRCCYDYCFGNKEPCSFCESYRVLETGKPHQWEVKCSDGSIISAYDFPFTDIDGSQKILEMDIDITEQKRMEKQLRDSERLAAIGATAGMVGHDIRNPLQAITSDVFIAKTELASTLESLERKNALESLEEIEKNVDYINKIVQDLQDYARPLNPKIEASDLHQVVDDIIKKSNNIPSNVQIKVQVADNARRIEADAYYLNRILYNLITNSVQALTNGGRVIVSASKDIDDTILSVEDTGPGIPEEVQSKMFTLMFTTKAKGQGFGLPVVKRMTESLGGTVTFESQEGKGTTFKVRIPPPRR